MSLEARSQLLAPIKVNLNSRLFGKVIFFLILKFIDKYNAIYNINKQRMTLKYKNKKIKKTDKIQLVYRMLQLLMNYRKKKLKMNS